MRVNALNGCIDVYVVGVGVGCVQANKWRVCGVRVCVQVTIGVGVGWGEQAVLCFCAQLWLVRVFC